jgi:hypothetical protein
LPDHLVDAPQAVGEHRVVGVGAEPFFVGGAVAQQPGDPQQLPGAEAGAIFFEALAPFPVQRDGLGDGQPGSGDGVLEVLRVDC